MRERDLLKQLNSLNNIKPATEFKNRNREILLNQLASSNDSEKLTTFNWFSSTVVNLPALMFGRLPQPAIAAILISIFVLGGGMASLRAAQDTKPGDSLYYAKIVSEKTQIALTFSEKKKAILGLEFAGNRAKELDQVLAEATPTSAKNDEVVERLRSDFKKEITVAKNRIEKMSTVAQKDESVKNEGDKTVADTEDQSGEDNAVFSANLEKEDTGLHTSEQVAVDATSDKATKEVEEMNDSSEGEVEKTVETRLPSSNPAELLEQAGLLLSKEDYSATLSKLDEVGSMLDEADKETEKEIVKPDTATTTDETIEATTTEKDADNGSASSTLK